MQHQEQELYEELGELVGGTCRHGRHSQNGENRGVEETAGNLLRQLDQSKKRAMKQQVADDILVQFGFK